MVLWRAKTAAFLGYSSAVSLASAKRCVYWQLVIIGRIQRIAQKSKGFLFHILVGPSDTVDTSVAVRKDLWVVLLPFS